MDIGIGIKITLLGILFSPILMLLGALGIRRLKKLF